ncbi:flagellar assembly protein FliH [Aeromonas cavernicola]|nr:flagellar assembly protein FliH [Aeromonas cavernicola]
MSNKLRSYVRLSGDDAQVETWGWPEIMAEKTAETNALGLASDWYQQEGTEVEGPPEPTPPPSITAEELDAIRQAAWEEGVAEGHAVGFVQGLEEGKLEGLQQGHSTGLEQGKEQGLALGRELIDEQMSHWQSLLDRLANPLAALDHAVEQQLITLVLQLARALIHHEAETSPRILLAALKQGLALLPAAEKGVTLMLHPDDVTRVEQAFGLEECAKRHWQLRSDPTLSLGDLQLATELSSIDMVLSGRIDQLLRHFLRDNASMSASFDTPSAHPAEQDSHP